MTENKLTLEDCLKYSNASLINPLGLKTKSVIELINYCYNANITINKLIKIDNLKLILRSIEQLTDEEKAQLLENHLNDQGRDILKRSSYSYGNFENRLYELDVKQTDYLRSISVDIDNFLKSGKAVKG